MNRNKPGRCTHGDDKLGQVLIGAPRKVEDLLRDLVDERQELELFEFLVHRGECLSVGDYGGSILRERRRCKGDREVWRDEVRGCSNVGQAIHAMGRLGPEGVEARSKRT